MKQTKKKVQWLILAASLISAACTDNATLPPMQAPPPYPLGDSLFAIEVKDTAGNPVPGLRVSSWFDLSIDFFSSDKSMSRRVEESLRYATVIRFSLLLTSRVELSVLDMSGALVRKLVDEVKPTGLHSVVWGGAPNLLGGVYKCRLIARDVLFNNVLFADSIYAVLWMPDPEQSVMGVTDSKGRYATNNSLRFPSVLDLPPLVSTDALCQIGEDFAIEDTVTIVLTDTDSGDRQTYQRTIKKGSNKFALVWNPKPTAQVAAAAEKRRRTSADEPVCEAKSGKQQLEWRLYQNCPNPFN